MSGMRRPRPGGLGIVATADLGTDAAFPFAW